MRRSARGALVAVGCLVLVLSLALVGCDSNARRIREINEVLATPAAERTRLTAKIDAIEIRDGDCIISSLPEGISIETVVIVPCSGTWQYRVLNSFLVAGGERYPGEDVFEQRAYEKCDRRYSFILFPLSESWSFGDRTVNCLQESFGLSIADPGKLDRLVNSESLSYGECYEGAPETGDLMVELVDCSGAWEFRALNSFEVTSERYPGKNFFEQRAQESCDRRSSHILSPGVESWSLGDRSVNCLQKSFGMSIVDLRKLDRLVNAKSLSFGECYNEAPETGDSMVELVDCSGTWEFRVLNSFDVADGDQYPEESYFWQHAYDNCDRRFSHFLFPLAESWSIGNRTVSCIQNSFGLSVVDSHKLDRLVDVSLLNPGECYNEAPETDGSLVELVDCSTNWEFRVLNSFAVADGGHYPEESFFWQHAYDNCDRRFSHILPPLVESWSMGDRTVSCVQSSFGLSVVDPDKLDRLANVNSLSFGDCFNAAPETSGLMAELVDCSTGWEFRVLNSFEASDADRYPGEAVFER